MRIRTPVHLIPWFIVQKSRGTSISCSSSTRCRASLVYVPKKPAEIGPQEHGASFNWSVQVAIPQGNFTRSSWMEQGWKLIHWAWVSKEASTQTCSGDAKETLARQRYWTVWTFNFRSPDEGILDVEFNNSLSFYFFRKSRKLTALLFIKRMPFVKVSGHGINWWLVARIIHSIRQANPDSGHESFYCLWCSRFPTTPFILLSLYNS